MAPRIIVPSSDSDSDGDQPLLRRPVLKPAASTGNGSSLKPSSAPTVAAPAVKSKSPSVASAVRRIDLSADDDDDSDVESTKPLKKTSATRRIQSASPMDIVNSDDNDEDVPLIKSKPKPKSNMNASKRVASSDSEEDVPLSKSRAQPPARKSTTPAKTSTKRTLTPDSSSGSDSDEYLAAKTKRSTLAATPAAASTAASTATKRVKSESGTAVPVKANGKKAAATSSAKVKAEPKSAPATPKGKTATTATSAASRKRAAAVKDESDADEEPKSKSARTTKRKSAKEEMNESSEEADNEDDNNNNGEDGDGDGEDDGEYKWWLNDNNSSSKDGVKWKTLRHNGVLFPPEYEVLNIPLIYNGRRLNLEPDAEEVAWFFGQMLDTEHAKNATFQKNFFSDFKSVLKECKSKHAQTILDFNKCDFSLFHEYHLKEVESRKNMNKEQKAAVKAEKDKLEAPFLYAFLDGRKEKVGNFRIEPPGLFRGRGDHPKKGALKRRVRPEQITLNLSKDAKIPDPPAGHKWGKITHDNTVVWLASWKENVQDMNKYVQLAATSSLKGMSDLNKFETARRLHKHIDGIRKSYETDLKDRVAMVRQRATAMYLIDKLALRAGTEKGDDEADTVGCCSLRVEHVTLESPSSLHFDFLGKDSIRYQNTVAVTSRIYKNIEIFKRGKREGDMLFDLLDVASLNEHLKSFMPGLSAKVFRTYNASHTFQQQLDLLTVEGTTVAEKLLAFNRANRDVAVLCNHQKSVSKGHQQSMDKLTDKVRMLKYQRRRYRAQLKELDPVFAKKNKSIMTAESDLEDEWISDYMAMFLETEREKVVARHEAMLRDDADSPAPSSQEAPSSQAKKKAAAAAAAANGKKNGKKTVADDDDDDDDDDDEDDTAAGASGKSKTSKITALEEQIKGLSTAISALAKAKGKISRKMETEVFPATKIASLKPGPDNAEKLKQAIEKLDERINAQKMMIKVKDETKTESLGTSKTNYLDPRISMAWCKKHKVPVEKIFTKTLRDKFQWATTVDADWKF